MDEPQGTAIIVDGKIVAWFATFDDAAQGWCTENHFGKWLATWRTTPPTVIPLTTDELDAARAKAREMAKFFADGDRDGILHKPED